MSHVKFYQDGLSGCIELDRPEALNALTVEMVCDISHALDQWHDDKTVSHVIIKSSSERAFCAGGDVRQAVSFIAADPIKSAEPYFAVEYGLDVKLASYSKPIISLVNGVVMGGGLGLARLASYMVISSNIKLAMPETAIGLFPDVGAAHFLRRAPLPAAVMIGMTGSIIGAGDAMAWQLADYHCPFDDFASLQTALGTARTPDEISACLHHYAKPAPDAQMYNSMSMIDQIFGQAQLADIVKEAARHQDDPLGAKWHHALQTRCPASIGLFWHLMRQKAPPKDAIAAIHIDYFLACKMMRRSDFPEGVRAVLIDKDNAPKWQPASIEEIDDQFLADLFDFAAMSPLPA